MYLHLGQTFNKGGRVLDHLIEFNSEIVAEVL